MKKFIPVIITCLTLQVQAQTQTTTANHANQKHVPAFLKALGKTQKALPTSIFAQNSTPHGFSKTTGSVTRLLSMAEKSYGNNTYVNDGDSTKIFWHGTLGGNFNLGALYTNYVYSPFTIVYDPNSNTLPYDSIYNYSTTTAGGAYNNLYYKEIQVFDANNNPTSSVGYELVNNIWTPSYKSESVFNSNNLLISKTNYNWNNNMWVFAYKEQYTYDAQARLASSQLDNFNGTQILPYNKVSYAYNSAGKLTESIYQLWDNVNNAFQNQTKTLIAYNSSSKPVQQLEFFYNANNWDTLSKKTGYYNTSNHLDSIIENYHTAGNWQRAAKYITTTDANDRLLTLDYKTYNVNTMTYDNAQKAAWTYNTDYITSYYLGQWDSTSNMYQYYSKDNYTYNAANLLDSYYETEYNGTTWAVTNGGYKTNFYYETFVSIKDLAGDIDFAVSPNPSHNYINISSKEAIEAVNITDVQGRNMMTLKGNSNMTINVSEFPAGTYFIQITTQHGTGTKQMSVTH